jgi:3'(2'), 5'-bisphosphate nucleotidase
MVRRIAYDAGQITLKYFDDIDGYDVATKSDGSPVSLADREAEALIKKSLHDLLPGVPMIGEEATEAGDVPDLDQQPYFWLVDALDGTKEFISGGDEFTVNIALMHHHQPVLGVVYAPAKGVCYTGHAPGSAMRWNEDTKKEKSIKVRRPPDEGLIVVASVRHGDAGQMNDFLEQFKIQKVIKRGSSLKICAVAEGKADLYPRFGPTSFWDTAAGHAVLNAAGGIMTDDHGQALPYKPDGLNFLNPSFIAASFDCFAEASEINQSI